MIDEQWRCDEFDVGARSDLLKQGKKPKQTHGYFSSNFRIQFYFSFSNI
jgi:hypothetical protein